MIARSALVAVLFGLASPAVAQQATASIVVDSSLGAPAQHGLQTLTRELEAKQYRAETRNSLARARNSRIIVMGLTGQSAAVRQLAETAGLALPSEPESLLVRNLSWNGRPVLLICGADERGLMYAALDAAEQIRLYQGDGDPLSAVSDATEQPSIRERSVTKMLMNRSEAEQYLHSEQYWTSYLDMLARDRFNTFVLMFGYGSAGYFDPPYPFLFDIPEFPAIRATGITKADQQRYLDTFHKIGQMAHDRGLDFVVALWTHIFVPGYNNVVSTGKRKGIMDGLNGENLVPYTKVALARFLREFPEIDALQFRVHTESSVTLPQQQMFWTEVLRVVNQVRPGIRVDMRAKGFSDDLIETALDSGVKMRLTSKQWGEQMGLPYHPTEDTLENKFERRHSYADLLRYPRRYDILYRLWSHGTTRILLWGDPDYARRFAQSSRLWGGAGFDVYEPLAMKMGYKLGLHDTPSFALLSPDHQYYRWEFERYWHYYQVFGRLGYNLDAPPRVWRAEFENRFGKAAGPVEQTYAAASKVLPRIVAYALRDLSAGFAWAEKQRWEDLPDYIHVRPSDVAQFLGIDEAARLEIAGESSAKIWPEQNSRWFAQQASTILQLAREAEDNAGDSPSKEFLSTMIDMKVLAQLAAYHSRRLLAGMGLALFEKSGDVNSLDDAIYREREAIAEWEKIVDLTEGVYPENIIFGRAPRMDGNWKTELAALRKGLAKLEQQRISFRPPEAEVVARFDFGDGPVEKGFQPVTRKTNYVFDKGGYGWYDAFLMDPPDLAAGVVEPEHLRDFVRGPEAAEYPYSAFGVDLPNGKYELRFEMADRSANPESHGPMWITAQGRESTEHFSIPAGELVRKNLRAAVVDGRLNIVFSSATDGDWIVNSFEVAAAGPRVFHAPIRKGTPGEELLIRATATRAAEPRSLTLIYGTPDSGFSRIPMGSTDTYSYAAAIPAESVVHGLVYYLEAEGPEAERAWFPPEGPDQPIAVSVTRDREPPAVFHQRITRWTPGKPLRVAAAVTDPSGVASVHVRYRGLSQHQDFSHLRLLPTGKPNKYAAEIPGANLDSRWDFMYYLEALDKEGNGRIYPNLEDETPYVVVRLHDSGAATAVSGGL